MLDHLESTRDYLVIELKRIESEVEYSMLVNAPQRARQIIQQHLDDNEVGIWPQIVNQSATIFTILQNQGRIDDRDEESAKQMALMDTRARILFLAK